MMKRQPSAYGRGRIRRKQRTMFASDSEWTWSILNRMIRLFCSVRAKQYWHIRKNLLGDAIRWWGKCMLDLLLGGILSRCVKTQGGAILDISTAGPWRGRIIH